MPNKPTTINNPRIFSLKLGQKLKGWQCYQRLVADLNVKTIHISPGSPWEQTHIESFHDKFRDECLNRELFESLAVAKVIVDQCRKNYNQQRPHSSLGYQTPDEFAAICNRRLQSGYALLPSPI